VPRINGYLNYAGNELENSQATKNDNYGGGFDLFGGTIIRGLACA
jgi:hypothetical protein